MPGIVTLYYDPILEIHQRLPVTFAMTYAFYLAPQVPAEARRLFDAAAANAQISDEGFANPDAHRINAIAWFLSREWGIDSLEAAIRSGLEENYNHEAQFRSALPELTGQPNLTYGYFSAADHTFSKVAQQTALISRITEWMRTAFR